MSGLALFLLTAGSSFCYATAAPVGPAVTSHPTSPETTPSTVTPQVDAPANSVEPTDEPVAVPVPTAARAGMAVFAVAGLWRMGRRIRLTA